MGGPLGESGENSSSPGQVFGGTGDEAFKFQDHGSGQAGSLWSPSPPELPL